MPEVTGDSVADQAFKFLCRHLVSLSGRWQPLDQNGEPIGGFKLFSYSGFILSIGDVWCLLTAGHVLKKINTYRELKNAKIAGFQLVDSFGPAPVSKIPIPFNYDDNPHMFFAPEEFTISTPHGLDFGLIYLNPNQKALLQANGIVPLSEENRMGVDTVECDWHCILGLPEQWVTETTLTPTIIPVTKLTDMPEGVVPTEFTRFIGLCGDKLDIDIEGMSGGPIFGFRRDVPDRYWIVGIQSAWLPDRKITFGCPVPVFMELLEEMINDERDDESSADEQLAPTVLE